MIPEGYKELPDGVKCRCINMWSGTGGKFYCCSKAGAPVPDCRPGDPPCGPAEPEKPEILADAPPAQPEPQIIPPTPSADDLPDGEYAIVELFGHRTLTGRISEVERFGTKMICVNPIFENKLLPAVFHGGTSLYGVTPCSKEVAFKRQAKYDYELPETIRATLAPTALPAPFPRDEIDEDDEGEF